MCRSKRLVTHEDDELFTGFQFGSRGSKTATARIYDKTHELRSSGKEWVESTWNASYTPGQRVLRVEFEVGRTFLRQVELTTPDEVVGSAPALWAGLTENWLTFREPSADATRSRWPIAPEWESIQCVSLRGQVIGLKRLREAENSSSIAAIVPGLTGYLSSAAALLGTTDVHDTMPAVARLIESYAKRTNVQFSERVLLKSRRVRYA